MSIEEKQASANNQNKEIAEARAEETLPEIKEEDEVPQPQLNNEGKASVRQ